ncbi:hypothetical protein D9619_006474 [Psilocybe cf. subviscida]|uniref:Uncharacterized protein n=1 Tax=Psilocybe cf. subviscida TaxID=2480587 RepID=A0A8H5EXR0_9AGAR|nr:hypothetical protein D9619_006474 [Psilocybe cf. subviscida]
MGFLKRLMSLGGKKNKKDSRPHIVHNVPVPELPWSQSQDAPIMSNEEEHEAAVGRLLRSSSARFAESTELNYANLPPLPHPINNVIQTPASSSLSIASTTLARQGTYNVTVHKRRRHVSTEPVPPLPNSNDHNDASKPVNKKRKSLLTADDSRVMRLRSDPSVASLLSLYDDHGKLAADAFSNDTPREKEKRTSKSAPTTMNMRPQPKIEPLRTGDEDRERAQVKRSGSTLRQLLGASTSSDPNDNNPDNSGSGEGDISWAERFLAETESASSHSHSSIGPETPITTHSTHFYTEPLKGGGDSFSTDLSTATIDDPAISSMEVEVSASDMLDPDMDNSMHLDAATSATAKNAMTNTPRRASQVFDFLTRGKQSTAVESVAEDTSMGMDIAMERTLPELPSCFSSPSSDDHGAAAASKFKFTDPPTFTFTPTMTIPEDEDDTQKGLRVALPALPDNTPRPVRHHAHQRSNSAKAVGYTTNDFARSTTAHQRSESQDLRSAFSDDSHGDINVNDDTNALTSTTVPFTPLVNRAAHPNTRTHVESTIHEDQVHDHCNDDAAEKKNDIKVMLNGPTKVIVTAPTPGFNPSGPGRLPRGPRALPSKSSAAMERRRSALVERSNSPSSASNSASASAWSPNKIRTRERSGSQSSTGTRTSDASGTGTGAGNMSISDPFTLGHPRRRANTAHAAAQRVRSPSTSSINSFTRALRGEREERGYTIREKEKEKERLRAREHEKENHGQTSQKRSRSPLALAKSTLGLSVKTELPATPMRSQSTGSRALLKAVVQQTIAFRPPLPPASSPGRSRHTSQYDSQYDSRYDRDQDVDALDDKHLHGTPRARTPSPASSSEMSPVGRQMMLDVRQQRLNARLAERERAATRRGGSERRVY